MARDIVETLDGYLNAYPEDIFPTPPDHLRAKDSAAADVMRVLALPAMQEARDEIVRLRAQRERLLLRLTNTAADFVTVAYSQSEDGFQQLWVVECAEHGSVGLYGTGEEAWAAKRDHEPQHEGADYR